MPDETKPVTAANPSGNAGGSFAFPNDPPCFAPDADEGAAQDISTLCDRLSELWRGFRAEARTDPFSNPVLRMALALTRELDQGDVTLADIEGAIAHMAAAGFARRAERAGAYVGETDAAQNADRLRALFRALAKNDDGSPKPFAEFQSVAETFHYGIVFTAHPTFSNPVEIVRAMAQLAAGVDAKGDALTDSARADIVKAAEAARHRPPPITLAREYAIAGEAIAGAEAAIRQLHTVVLEVAREVYPGDWRALCPGVVSLASWVGYDHDGRSDIGWADTIRIRLQAKVSQLEFRRAECAALRAEAPRSAAGRTLELVESRLALAAKQVRLQTTAAEAASNEDGSAEDQLKADTAFAHSLVDGRADALTGVGDLVGLLARAQEEADESDPGLAVRIGVARAGLAGRGLADAHCHFRLNAAQLHNAVRRDVGLEGSPTNPSRRRSYIARMNELIAGVKPVTVNVGSLTSERASARRMFMAIAEIAKHVDAESPVRFLIAETESAFTLLAALYFAKLFGVEDVVEISPLFETESALQNGDQLIEEALGSPHFRAYVERTGRLCLQFGYSDSGRYVGQMAATFGIERLRLRIAAVLARFNLHHVQVVLFNTHGESIGRGGHPAALTDRLRYLAPPASHDAFLGAGIAVREESSFQGTDGYLWFLSKPLAFATLTRIVETELGPEPEQETGDDPIYDDPDFAVEFFAVVRQAFGELLEDADYAALLGVFGHGLSDSAGSRPVRRQHEFQAGPRAFGHPSQIRAISNNTVLHQVGFLANTVAGLGRAAARDPDRFAKMRAESPRFARAMTMAEAALTLTDPDVLRAYVDTFDPGMWLARAAHAREADRRADLRAVAEHLEKTAVHGRLDRVFRKLFADHLPLVETYRGIRESSCPDSLRASTNESAVPDESDREALGLLHALRIAVLQRAWLTAMHIPDFTPYEGVDRDGLIQRILHLEGAEAADMLQHIFPRREGVGSGADFAEAASYAAESSQTYEEEHALIFAPIAGCFTLALRLGAAITHRIGALG